VEENGLLNKKLVVVAYIFWYMNMKWMTIYIMLEIRALQ